MELILERRKNVAHLTVNEIKTGLHVSSLLFSVYMLESHCWADLGSVSQETTLEAECSWYTEGLLVPKKPSTWAQVVMRLPQSTSKPAVSWQGFSSHPQSQPALSLLHQGVRKGLANRAFGISGLS